MMRRMTSVALGFVLVTAAAIQTPAEEPPTIKNTELTVMSAATGLSQAMVRAVEENRDELWVGYSVPARPGVRMCCGDWKCRSCECQLEGRNQSYNSTVGDDDEDLKTGFMRVLFRYDDGHLERIAAFSEDCRLNAQDVPCTWLTDVREEESIDWLTAIVDERDDHYSMEHVIERAVNVIAMHASPKSLDVLTRFTERDYPEDVREDAVFWIGNNGGRRGVEVLRRFLDSDPDPDLREKAVFALTLPEEPEALDVIIDVARNDHDADVRSNAIFWLSNKAGRKAADAISDAIEEDPDTDVKEQAVFALSQLPDEEGIPLLINVARTNRNRDVREKAIFWLGQSEDPRVIDFFEEVLGR